MQIIQRNQKKRSAASMDDMLHLSDQLADFGDLINSPTECHKRRIMMMREQNESVDFEDASLDPFLMPVCIHIAIGIVVRFEAGLKLG